MGWFFVILLFVLVVAAGVFGGRNTIKRDMIRTEQDDAQLDKLHKLRG